MKYELTNECIMKAGRKLFRIKALVDIGDEVKAGYLGGFIEKKDNLSHEGNAWVSGDACVYDNARVSDDAFLCGNAWVSGDARVYGNASVSDDACLCGNARVSGNARVNGDDDYAAIKGFGTEYRTTTFFRCVDKEVRVTCGCFYGTIEEFRKQVKATREGKIADEYLKIADLMEEHFKTDSE